MFLSVCEFLENCSHSTPLSEDKKFSKGLGKMCSLHKKLAGYHHTNTATILVLIKWKDP